MNCQDAYPLMHEYLDGALDDDGKQLLNRHLTACSSCRNRFERLERTEAYLCMIAAETSPQVSGDFTERVMAALPAPGRMSRVMRWMRRHPAASVAALFALVMMSSFLSLWKEEDQLVLKGADLDGVVVEGNTVIVPAGTTIRGDLLVENGTLQVDGNVEGNLTVVDGSLYLASTARIAGQVTRVDQTIESFWFRIKQFFSGFTR